MTSSTLPKATAVESKRGARECKAKKSTSGTENFDPYLVGGAVEGLWEAATMHGNGATTVGGPSMAKIASRSSAPSPKETQKPPRLLRR